MSMRSVRKQGKSLDVQLFGCHIAHKRIVLLSFCEWCTYYTFSNKKTLLWDIKLVVFSHCFHHLKWETLLAAGHISSQLDKAKMKCVGCQVKMLSVLSQRSLVREEASQCHAWGDEILTFFCFSCETLENLCHDSIFKYSCYTLCSVC